MRQSDERTRLLQALDRAAAQARSADAQLMKELEKCPSSKPLVRCRQRPQHVPLRQGSRRTPHRRSRLDSSTRLIAPAHDLTLPTLQGVKDRFAFSFGSDAALPLARALIEKGLLGKQHLQAASSPVSALKLLWAIVWAGTSASPRTNLM